MHFRSVSYWVLAWLLLSTATLIAQTPDIQQKVDQDLTLKRLQGAWTPELLVTTSGAEAYPLAGRAVSFEGNSFTRIEGKHIVASGSFKAEDGYLSLTVKDRSPWDLEAADTKVKIKYAFKIEGDVLTLCYAADNTAQAGDLTPGNGRQVVIYKRQRASIPVQPAPAKP